MLPRPPEGATDARGIASESTDRRFGRFLRGRQDDPDRAQSSPQPEQRGFRALFDSERVASFLAGVNVNVMAYGQTGSGKTHTMFGPPGIMASAARGAYGDGVCAEYGLFPRGLLAVFEAVEERRRAGETLVLTGSAIVRLPLSGGAPTTVVGSLAATGFWGDDGFIY